MINTDSIGTDTMQCECCRLRLELSQSHAWCYQEWHTDNETCHVQAGAIHGLVGVLKDPKANVRALAHASFVLKRLTATKYISRASFVMCQGPAALVSILQRREECTADAAEVGPPTPVKAIE